MRGAWHRRPLVTAAGLAPVGRGDASFLDDLADGLIGSGLWLEHPACWLVAADLANAERVAFGARGMPVVPLRHALRASWAIPGWFRPVAAHGRRYADGGILSPTSADLVRQMSLDEVVVIAPMASAADGRTNGLAQRAESLVLRREMSRILAAETAVLRGVGMPVLQVLPDEDDLAELGPNFMSRSRRLPALDVALDRVPSALAARAASNVLRLSG
jgi:NTE family protein